MAPNPLCSKLHELGYDCSDQHNGSSSTHTKTEWFLLKKLQEAEDKAESLRKWDILHGDDLNGP